MVQIEAFQEFRASLTYLRDEPHLYSEKIAYEIRDRIVEAQRNVPGLLDLENQHLDPVTSAFDFARKKPVE